MIHKIEIPILICDEDSREESVTSIDMALVTRFTKITEEVNGLPQECTLVKCDYDHITCLLSYKQFNIFHEAYMSKTENILKHEIQN